MSRYYTILVLAAFLAMELSGHAQNVNALVRKGNTLYKQGKFDKALPFYQKAFDLNNNNPVTSFNLGDAFFRNQQLAEAERSFDRALSPAVDVSIRQNAFYNKGVSLSKQNKLEESITAYKNAVILNPGDEDARVNLQKALLELKKENRLKSKKRMRRKSRIHHPKTTRSRLHRRAN